MATKYCPYVIEIDNCCGQITRARLAKGVLRLYLLILKTLYLSGFSWPEEAVYPLGVEPRFLALLGVLSESFDMPLDCCLESSCASQKFWTWQFPHLLQATGNLVLMT